MAPSGTPVSNSNSTSILPTVLVSGWLILSAWGFWWFEYRHWQAYPEQLVHFDSQSVQQLYPILSKSDLGKPLAVHFADDNCPCEAYRVAHVETLQSVLTGAQQVTLSPNESRNFGLILAASPAVAIWNDTGQLAYFGPYSSGMTCGSGFDFVTMVFSKLNNDENPEWINTQGFGCFCLWQED